MSQFSSPASKYTVQVNGCSLLLGCLSSSVSNASAVADNSLTNYATASVTGLSILGSVNTSARAKLASTTISKAGDYAGWVVATSGLINVDLLNSITLKTYLNGTFQEQSNSGTLIGLDVLGLLGTPQNEIAFKTTKDFDEVEIIFGGSLIGVSLFNGTQYYYAFGAQTLQPPTIAVLTPANNATTTTSPVFSGTASPGSTVVLTGTGSTTLCSTTVSTSGSWSCLISVSLGLQSVTAIARNQVGASSPVVTQFTAVSPVTNGVGVINCAATFLIGSIVPGTPGSGVLKLTTLVNTAGLFPVTVQGSGLSLQITPTVQTAASTGSQVFYIPVNYNGSTLNTFTVILTGAGTCSYDLSNQTPRGRMISVLDIGGSCPIIIPGTLGK
ncbi:hypothetical protein [Arsenicibacter rosenii]|uniref:Bacterial Ig-like domain-containing protein n=1 Tax=Arsenicibacter rosenii TaxID=1750698 RepID=A0A1S2VIS7_9BACT|nr:hypothetical protein [Arsenicibacter rosenii]OIN57748.1 hypothetical protein BLX24_18575 [Arsenicibacter rosenii]